MARNTANPRGDANSRSFTSKRLLALTAAGLVANGASVSAAEWEFAADLFTGITYTDNFILSPPPGEDEEYVWELSPTIIASRDGKRVDIEFDYRLQSLFYAREDRLNEAYNYLQSTLQALVIPDFLFFDADASISQTVIDPRVASGNSSISVSGNTAETMTINASPYILRRLAPSTFLRLGASAGLVEYDEPRLIDNNQLDYFGSITNSGGGGPLDWSLGFTSKRVEYDVDREIELARYSAEVGIRISPRTEFVMSGGEDINDFGALPGTRVAEGTFWNVGFRGGFGDTVEFDLRVGEQFFGDSYGVQFTRSSRALTTSLNYSEEATTIGAQQLDFSNGLSLLNLAGNFANEIEVDGFELPTRDPELYIRRRLDFSNTLESGRSSIRAGIYYEDRSFIRTELDGARENVRGASFEWSWELDGATSVATRATYQLLDSRDEVSRPEDLRISVQMRREILNQSYITASIGRNERNAPQANQEYEELAIRIGFGRRF
ncbi:MAG: TIGR03016 family PEP-CTERM system-associated outer membrane protein [Pseudomonadota bacterium]